MRGVLIGATDGPQPQYFRGVQEGRTLHPATQLQPNSMTLRNISAKPTRTAQIQQGMRLERQIQVNPNKPTAFGSVANARGYTSNARRAPSSFTAVLTNGTGGALEYVIGDPVGAVAGRFGRTFTQPTSVTGTTVAAFQAMFQTMPLLISGFNYFATSGAVQFPQLFRYYSADITSGFDMDVSTPEYQRNTAQNPNLLTLDFGEGFEVDTNTCFGITVAAGQSVTIVGFIGAAMGR